MALKVSEPVQRRSVASGTPWSDENVSVRPIPPQMGAVEAVNCI